MIEIEKKKRMNETIEKILKRFNLACTGLFHKAILQSGVAINPWASIIKEPSKYAFMLAAKLGESSADPETVVEFLRTIDMQKLVAAELKLITPQVSLARDNYYRKQDSPVSKDKVSQ